MERCAYCGRAVCEVCWRWVTFEGEVRCGTILLCDECVADVAAQAGIDDT